MLASAALFSYNHWSGETLHEASKMSGAGASLAEVRCTNAFMSGVSRPSPPQLALMGQQSGIKRGALFLRVLRREGASFVPASACPFLCPRKGENTIVGHRTAAPSCFKAHCKVFIFFLPVAGLALEVVRAHCGRLHTKHYLIPPKGSNPRPQHGRWSPDVEVFSFVPNALRWPKGC